MTQASLDDYEKPWQNEQLLREYYLERKMSMYDIADRFGCSQNTISKYCRDFDIETRGGDGRPRKKKVSYFTATEWENAYEVWNESIYREQVKVHRLIAVAEHGVDAVADKHVHHKNGIPWDNRPDNLEVLSLSDHMSLHHEQGDYD